MGRRNISFWIVTLYGEIFIRRLRAMGIRDRRIASRSPWQNGHAERLIGSLRAGMP
jgi:transposase InsO family protein